MKNILSYAAEADPSIDANTVSIMSPCFMAQVDAQAGAANSTNLYWSKTGWFSGTYAEGPNDKDKISSFDILDNLAAHYADKTIYPNLQVRLGSLSRSTIPTHRNAPGSVGNYLCWSLRSCPDVPALRCSPQSHRQ